MEARRRILSPFFGAQSKTDRVANNDCRQTQDWHPKNHSCFASSHPDKGPFETMVLAYSEQILWPDHCIQGTPSPDLHAGRDIPGAQLVLRKGHHEEIDSYSVFFENDRRTPTGLTGYLRERRFHRVWLAELALDFCVRYSGENACRAFNTEGSLAATRKSLTALAGPLRLQQRSLDWLIWRWRSK